MTRTETWAGITGLAIAFGLPVLAVIFADADQPGRAFTLFVLSLIPLGALLIAGFIKEDS